jgi:serine protease Do
MKLMKAVLLAAVVMVAVLAFSFAVPAHGQGRDRDTIQRLEIFDGPGSRIGVTARELDQAEVERLKVPGVFLETVTPDGPAAKAGMRPDDVVVEFDGERVRSLRQFTRLVRETPASRSVKAVVMRDGKRTEVIVTPADGWPDVSIDTDRIWRQVEEMTARMRPFEGFEFPEVMARSRLGVTVNELTPELAAYFGAADGVLVASVTADSPAARSGLNAGDVITSVDGRVITSAAGLVRELRNGSTGGEVTLGIVRDKKASSVTAKMEVPERRERPRQARPIRTPV